MITQEVKSRKTVITYGTFDTLHYGHIELLNRARALGDWLIVGVSTEGFNNIKGKGDPKLCLADRRGHLLSLKAVDKVIYETSFEQKVHDFRALGVDVLVMGDDWKGEFDDDCRRCGVEVVYLPRTPGISSTMIREGVKDD